MNEQDHRGAARGVQVDGAGDRSAAAAGAGVGQCADCGGVVSRRANGQESRQPYPRQTGDAFAGRDGATGDQPGVGVIGRNGIGSQV